MRPSHIYIDKASDPLFLMDRQGRIASANEAACQTLGYTRQELLAMNFVDIDNMLAPAVWAKHWQELEISRMLRFESEYRKKDGGLMPVSITSHFIQMDGQEYICAIAQNPTGQQWELSEAQESNERFRLLFNNATVGMARISVNGEFLQVNDAFCQLIGYSREEILAKSMTFQQITFHEDRDSVVTRYRQLLEGQISSFSIMARYIQKRGAIVWAKLSANLMRDPLGNPLYFIGTALDMTDSKKIDVCHHLASAVFAHTDDGIVVTDLEGRIESVNPAFAALTGYEEQEVLGRNPGFLKSSRHPPGFYVDLWESLKSNSHWRGEIWSRHKNGKIQPRLLTINAITDDDGEALRYVGIFSDISKLKASEAKLDFLAHHDPLTGLVNRRLLELRVEHALAFARRNRSPLALLMIDLDHFKEINHKLGYRVGDELIKAVGQRFYNRLRHSDTVARLGGDKFAVLLENAADHDIAGRVAKALLAQLDAPVQLDCGAETKVDASIGISLFPAHGDNYSELMQHAEAALYQAKDAGRRTFRVFT